MTKFRPCIDLHSGQVKQIVGGTLSSVAADLKTNYVSKLPASYYAELYKKHDLRGGHVVKLGPGNEEAAQEALRSWPGGLQVAGGINDKNAQYWIDQGAEKVSCLCDQSRMGHVMANSQFTYPNLNLLVMLFFDDEANSFPAKCGTTGDHHIIPLPLG